MDTTKAKALVKNIVADADTIDALITDNARLEKEVADVSVKLRMRETELGNVKSREEFYRAQTEALSDGINAHRKLRAAHRGQGSVPGALDAIDAWERKNGHRVAGGEEFRLPGNFTAAPAKAPAPERFRAGLPTLAMRKACAEWELDDGSVYVMGADKYRGLHWPPHVCGTPYADVSWSNCAFRPHDQTWSAVEHKAARMLGETNKNLCLCGDCERRINDKWLREQLGIPADRDMTTLWAEFREGQRS